MMDKSEILNLETRREIYNCIQNNPGLNLREISRRLKLKYFNVNYHVNYLKKLGLVTIKSDDSFSRIYSTNSIGTNDKEVLNIIRRKTIRHILIYFWYMPATTQQELAENLDKHPSTINFHITKLIELGIIEPAPIKDGLALTNIPSGRNVERTPIKNETLYRVKNPALVKKLFITYRKSLFKDKFFKAAFEYIYAADNYDREGKLKCNIRTMDWWFDYYMEIMLDVFPHPYHV
jgi:DNA-binding MarR family transcriptional regulator